MSSRLESFSMLEKKNIIKVFKGNIYSNKRLRAAHMTSAGG